MNAITAIGAGLDGIGDGERALVRLMRSWVALRRGDEPVLPALLAVADSLGLGGHAAVAVDSMLSLTEACLARQLGCERDDSRSLDFDERAVLALIDQGQFIDGAHTPRTIPHGLPGVLAWATVAVRRAFAQAGLRLDTPVLDTPGLEVPRPDRVLPTIAGSAAKCPFVAAPRS